jgi:hypothetical protein
MVDRVLVSRILGWFLYYCAVTAVPPVFLSTVFMALGLIIPNLADLFTPFLLLTTVAVLLIRVVILLPFARYTCTRYYGINPQFARERVKESGQEDPERKAFGILIGLGGSLLSFR